MSEREGDPKFSKSEIEPIEKQEADPKPGKQEQTSETELKHDISEVYRRLSPVEFIIDLHRFNKDDELLLELDVSEANPESITYLMNNFPRAKVVIVADREDYEKRKVDFPISVEWFGNQ